MAYNNITYNNIAITLILVIIVFTILLLVEKRPKLCLGIVLVLILFIYIRRQNATSINEIYDAFTQPISDVLNNNMNGNDIPGAATCYPSGNKLPGGSVNLTDINLDNNMIDRAFQINVTPAQLNEYINKVPELQALKEFQKVVAQEIDKIKTDSSQQKKYIKLDIDSKIARIYYFAYSTAADNYFPQHNYVEVLNAEREVRDAFHNLIFLGISGEEEAIQANLIAKFEEIYKKINVSLVNLVNSKNYNADGSNNLNSRSGFLPHPEEPAPYPNADDINAFQMLRN
jgi:hypothetical protein